jgi:hypothetical protein
MMLDMSEDVDVRTGDEILRSLGIPSPTMVYCPANDALLQVTDRSAPVGLCCQLDSQTKFYLTADELYAVRHSVCFNYQFGFDVSIPPQAERFRSILSAETTHNPITKWDYIPLQ